MEQIAQYADLIYASIISVAPALVSILGVIIAGIKILNKFSALRKAVDDKTDVTELKVALTHCEDENAKLKKQLRKVLAKLDHIDEKDLKE